MWGRLAAAVTDLLLGSQQLSVRSTRKAASHSTSTSCQLTYSAIQAVLQRVGQLLPAAAASRAGQQAKPISVHIAKPVSKGGLGRGGYRCDRSSYLEPDTPSSFVSWAMSVLNRARQVVCLLDPPASDPLPLRSALRCCAPWHACPLSPPLMLLTPSTSWAV